MVMLIGSNVFLAVLLLAVLMRFIQSQCSTDPTLSFFIFLRS